jgi:hypothetical protein
MRASRLLGWLQLTAQQLLTIPILVLLLGAIATLLG